MSSFLRCSAVLRVAPSMFGVLAFGCGVDPNSGDTADTAGPPAETGPFVVEVQVTLDGEPLPDAPVMQGGTDTVVRTGPLGTVQVTVDPDVEGVDTIVAGAPGAWNGGKVASRGEPMTIELYSFSPVDNLDYAFLDAGVTEEEPVADKCSHCHLSIHEGWRESAHRTSAQNPVVQGVYQGVDLAVDEAACGSRGTWGPIVEPGTGAATEGCEVAPGVTGLTGGFGLCADCHAPAVEGGSLAGNDLLAARDRAYRDGVTCDLCHKIESVEVGGEPGVGGWLRVLRPGDPSPSPILGVVHPLQFGPYLDVINPYMGAVQRDHFRQSELCGGCHQHEQPALDPAAPLDAERWPGGTLPIQGTYAEWVASDDSPDTPCQECHRPVLSGVGNSADLGNVFELVPDSAAGWVRPPGAVRSHGDLGPRQADSGILERAASVDVVTAWADGEVTASVTVRNVGAGHAIPTGEPLRNLVLVVEAECEGVPLAATGGDVVPGFGGAVAVRSLPDALDRFPEAEVGDTIRLAQSTGWIDYAGSGPFGDGTFTAAEKGMTALELVGEVTVTSAEADGTVSVDRPEGLAEADTAFLVRDAGQLAGAAGFGFAKVLVDGDGVEGVPHFRAADVRSDNRIPAGAAWTSTHRFAAPCAAPDVHATLLFRAWPYATAATYGWALDDRVMAEAWN